MFMDFYETVNKVGVVPVVVIEDKADAIATAKALIEGGINFMEITLRTPCALEAIELVSRNVPDMIVGAGTVLNRDAAERAVKAGAKFIVSPGFFPDVVDYCQEICLPVIPGCVTPTEINSAINKGIKTVKFFPADVYGGIKAIKALSAPFGQIKFLPTGGVSEGNLKEFIENRSVAAVGGSWVCKKDDILNHDWEKITMLSSNAIKIIKETRT